MCTSEGVDAGRQGGHAIPGTILARGKVEPDSEKCDEILAYRARLFPLPSSGVEEPPFCFYLLACSDLPVGWLSGVPRL